MAVIDEAACTWRSHARMDIQLERAATAKRPVDVTGALAPSMAMNPSAMTEALCAMMEMKKAASTVFSESGPRALYNIPMATSAGVAAMQVPSPLRNAPGPFDRPLNPATIIAVWERARPAMTGMSTT
ncbi:hypothetical protein [uncultured Slackia sp.]|uniref:hypothetical protein n=1 Tax=uncultured Slackia sp. TaxID=665903 RepID=UPI00345A7642